MLRNSRVCPNQRKPLSIPFLSRKMRNGNGLQKKKKEKKLWVLLERSKLRVQAAEMSLLRIVAGLSLRVRSSVILEEMDGWMDGCMDGWNFRQHSEIPAS